MKMLAGKENDLDNSTWAVSTSTVASDGIPALSRKLKLLTATSIFFGNVAFGTALNTYGPTLTNFQNKYGTSDSTISLTFTILTGGFVLGALASGFLYKIVNRQLCVAFFLICKSALMFLTPYCPFLPTFFLSAGLLGACAGFYGSAQFVWIMEMMQSSCPPYVQAQHFFYALGTILSTLLFAPFLNKNDSSTEVANLTIPFSIVAILLLIAGVTQVILFIFLRYHPPPPEQIDDQTKPEVEQIGINWPKIRLVIFSCLFFGGYQSMENCTISYLPKFGQYSALSLSESDSTYITTGLTASYATTRFICIFAVFKLPLHLLLCGNILLSTIANTLLVGWASNSLPVLWTASILYGVGFSSMYACFSAIMERFLIVSDLIGALVLVVGFGVSAVYPLLIGRFIEDYPNVLGFVNYFSIAICSVGFGALSFQTWKNKSRR